MSKRFFQTLLLLIFVSVLFAEDLKKESQRWRLDFEILEKPTRIVVSEPDGMQNTYWYFRYIVRNDTERDIKYSINIKLVIDKSAPGVTENKVPELFLNAEIPSSIKDKEGYINSLQKYYDTDFPIVKKQIFSKLNMHPELTENEHKILKTLPDQFAKSISDIMKDVDLSYSEVETTLERLVSKNLAVSEEVFGTPTFIDGKISYANFIIDNKNVIQKKGDSVNGWEIISFSKNDIILKKDDIVKKVTSGSVIEYKYARSNKSPFEKNGYYYAGMNAKGTYKGLTLDKDKKYKFEREIIPKKSIRRGIAVFYGVSPETDFMAVVVSGLVDPIVRRYKVVSAHNEVLMIGYKIPGDEISIHRDQLVPLYKKWEVLSTHIVRKLDK